MDTPARSDGNLAPWTPSTVPARSGQANWDEPAMDAPGGPRMFSPQVVLRALKRHWWQILAVWLVGSVGLMYLAYTKIKPMYDAVSWLQVEPTATKVFTTLGGGGASDFGPYLDTQVLLVTSPDVLVEALSNPEVAATRKVKLSADPEVDLRKEIGVGIPQRGTHLIQVRMTGENSGEMVTIVNAVVDAYLSKARKWTDETSALQLESLAASERDFKSIAEGLKTKIRELTRKTSEKVQGLSLQGEASDPAKATEPKDPKDIASQWELTMEQFNALRVELVKLQIERAKAEITVKYLDEELRAKGGGTAAAVASGTMSEAELDEQVKQAFLDLPEATRYENLKVDMETRHKTALKRTRNNHLDPTVKRAKEDFLAAEADHNNYWQAMKGRLRRQIMAGSTGAIQADPAMAARESALSAARLDLERIKANEKLLEQRIRKASVEVKTANNEIFDIKDAEKRLSEVEANIAKVSQTREQLELEARQTRVKRVAKAKVTKSASGDNRMKAILAAPIVMLILSCLLFVTLEFKSGRVADPDEFSQRTRVGVIGVVPPLPSLGGSGRALSIRGQRDERRRVEEFVQSLDQLRVTLCAYRPGQTSEKRCVLITSATGGEGKTTLAAQLAGRCANAGLMTLLIDADLRRPSLGDLLEVPEGPGLVDVLKGDATPEAAMVVIGNAGGFHLLPAGTMGQDPSRLLHGERLGKLIAQFRETFDIVIVDAPPVLAVPDALLLGRWTDGAILAVRHDTSRFPLVERANRRLASVGVSVLGAVVNGCRTMESAYGSYRYTPYAAADAPGGETEI